MTNSGSLLSPRSYQSGSRTCEKTHGKWVVGETGYAHLVARLHSCEAALTAIEQVEMDLVARQRHITPSEMLLD